MTNTLQQLGPWASTYIPLISTIVVAVATVVLVLLTSRYVRLTRSLVEETQRSREPSVTLDFEIPDRSLRLVLTNHGQSSAKNIRIGLLKDVSWIERGRGPSGFAESALIKDGISYLTPSRKLKYFIGYPSWRDTPDEQMEASFSLSYEDERGKRFAHNVDFDFGQMREVMFESFTDSNLAVAEAIRDTERKRQSHERTRSMLNGSTTRKRKQCPMCAEMIPEEAKKCSHCNEIINGK